MKIFYSNRILILILFIIPILIFSIASPSLKITSNPKINVSIIDEDKTDLSKEYVKKLQNDDRIITTNLSYSEAVKEIEKNNISGILIVKKGFSKKIQEADNNQLLELIYPKDNYYFRSLSDIFVQHYFKDLTVNRNINYVMDNFEIERELYEKEYYEQYNNLNKDLYEFQFITREISGGESEANLFNEKNLLLYRYLFGVVFLIAYILILIQSIETKIDNKGIREKIILSRVTFPQFYLGNLLGGVVPIFLILVVQTFIFSLVSDAVFKIELLIYILLFSLGVGLLSNFIVKVFKNSRNIYLIIPYYIIIIWIFGNILVNLDFLSLVNIKGNILPGASTIEAITGIMMNFNIITIPLIVREISLTFIMIVLVTLMEYKEFKNATN
jgi:hypothetical protein